MRQNRRHHAAVVHRTSVSPARVGEVIDDSKPNLTYSISIDFNGRDYEPAISLSACGSPPSKIPLPSFQSLKDAEDYAIIALIDKILATRAEDGDR